MGTTKIEVSKREQAVALKIVGMLRDECRDDLVVAVKSLALANQMFQSAFRRTVEKFSLDKRAKTEGEGGKGNSLKQDNG